MKQEKLYKKSNLIALFMGLIFFLPCLSTKGVDLKKVGGIFKNTADPKCERNWHQCSSEQLQKKLKHHNCKQCPSTKLYCMDICRHLEIKKTQADESKRESQAGNCKEEDYKNCYRGFKWGESLKNFCSNDAYFNTITTQSRYGGFYEGNFKCDKLIADKVDSNLWRHLELSRSTKTNKECNAIAFFGHLIGRHNIWENLSEDQYFYIIANFKKKYGKDYQESECGGMKSFHWKKTNNDLDIFLFAKDNYKTKSIFARYIKLDKFKEFNAEGKSALKKHQDQNEVKDTKNLKSIGDDI